MTEPLALDDFEALARERLDPGVFDYYAGGAADEETLRENRRAFRRYRLRPRVLVDVSVVDPSTTLLGAAVRLPVGLAPVALLGLAHAEGEVAVARAAAAAGVVQCLSTMSSRALEDVAAAAPGGVRWFQLYVHKDRAVTADLVRRAARAGYRAIVLTVDLPVPGYRERELRRRFALPSDTALGNFTHAAGGGQQLMQLIAALHDQRLGWRDVAWVRGLSDLPLVVKGILTAEDAALAVEHGAAGVVVSNHGGRQLDRTAASIDVLAEVVAAVAGRVEVYVDGGVRRATDVLVALALGARAVFVGRPYLWALAADGEAGVSRALALVTAELETAMRLLGVTSPSAVTGAHVRREPR